MIMQAVVIEVQWERLLVLDLDTRQNVIVNTPNAGWFRPGNLIRIWYNGVMTNSIPPQISALNITAVPQDSFPPFQPPVGCPPAGCLPVMRPPVVLPPVLLPPVFRPPMRPSARPPHNRPGRPR